MRPLSGSASFKQPVQSAKSEHSSSELVLNVSMLTLTDREGDVERTRASCQSIVRFHDR